MTVHLVELPVSLKQLHIWAARRLGRAAGDEGLALHHLLGEIFGPAVLQPFRLMIAPRAMHGTIYAYTEHDATYLQAQARSVMMPDHAAVIALDRLRSLPRPQSAWQAGQRLGFDVKARPVVRLAADMAGLNEAGQPVSHAKGAEIDAFLSAALRGVATDRADLYLDWLAGKLQAAAQLDRSCTRLAAFERSRVYRNGKPIEGPDATFHGTLTVTDPVAFGELLARGIGRHRSYGYGLLLLRPPQRSF